MTGDEYDGPYYAIKTTNAAGTTHVAVFNPRSTAPVHQYEYQAYWQATPKRIKEQGDE